jgi:hypothetical protein
MQGIRKTRPTGEQIVGSNDTMFFIKPADVSTGRKVTYATHVCTMWPGKSEKYRVRMAVGGDQLYAYQDVRSPAVGVTDTKLHINSVISDAAQGARYCTCDIKDFFLGSAMCPMRDVTSTGLQTRRIVWNNCEAILEGNAKSPSKLDLKH